MGRTTDGLGLPHLQMLARAMDHVGDIVEICDEELHLEFVNQAFERLTGYAREEVLGKTPAEVLRGSHHPPEFYTAIWDTISAGRIWKGRIISRRKSGEPLIQDAVVSPVCDADGHITNYVAVKRDISEKVNLREQIMHDRLAAVGRLAAGVAHEINNPLTYVLGNLEMLAWVGAHSVPAAERREIIADATHGALRIKEIVQDLKSFSSPRGRRQEELDVEEQLDASARLVGNLIRHRARLVRDYTGESYINADPAWLGQVFVNLLVNAAESIGSSDVDSNEIRLRTDQRGGEVRVSISDTGCGIARDQVDHIFDSFFTTRPCGEGMGLGLSISRELVMRMGGTISVKSEEGRGSTFTLTFPASLSASASGEAAAPEPRRADSALRICIIDDDRHILNLLSRMLAHHSLRFFTDGRQALATLRREPFDAVICDLMMPRMSGVEVYRSCAAENPWLGERFIFITGGTFSDEEQAFVRDMEGRVLGKPFDAEQLEAMLHRAVQLPRELAALSC